MLIDNDSFDNLSSLATLPNLAKKVNEKYKKDLNSFKLFDLYLEKKQPYFNEVDKLLENLARAIYNVSYIIDPDLIYIGGAISKDHRFIKTVEDKLKENPFNNKEILIKPVTYFNDNNIYGAYKNLIDKIKANKKLIVKEDV